MTKPNAVVQEISHKFDPWRLDPHNETWCKFCIEWYHILFAPTMDYATGNSSLRLGQIIYNTQPVAVWNRWIVGTDADCFYDDEKIPAFEEAIHAIWKREIGGTDD